MYKGGMFFHKNAGIIQVLENPWEHLDKMLETGWTTLFVKKAV